MPKLRVGPFTYNVIETGAECRALLDGITTRAHKDGECGHCDHSNLDLRVHPDIAKPLKRETLLHEALHACTNLAGILPEYGRKKEERLVRRLAPVVLQMLRDNPWLVKRLLERDQ